MFIGKDAPTTRDELYARLAERGIQTKRCFYPALHLQGAYAACRFRYEGRLPVAQRASRQGQGFTNSHRLLARKPLPAPESAAR